MAQSEVLAKRIPGAEADKVGALTSLRRCAAFPVVPRDTGDMDKLRELGMGCPEKFEELLHFIGMAVAIVFREKSIARRPHGAQTFQVISTISTTRRCGKPVMQSDPDRAAGPEPLAAMIRLFTRPGSFA